MRFEVSEKLAVRSRKRKREIEGMQTVEHWKMSIDIGLDTYTEVREHT